MTDYKYIIIRFTYIDRENQDVCIVNTDKSDQNEMLLDTEINRYNMACELDFLPDLIADCKSRLVEIYLDSHLYTFNDIKIALRYYSDEAGWGYLDKKEDLIFKISLKECSVENLGNYYEVRDYLCSLMEKVNNLENENKKLRFKNGILKAMLHYQPGGEGEEECKQHFRTMLN